MIFKFGFIGKDCVVLAEQKLVRSDDACDVMVKDHLISA